MRGEERRPVWYVHTHSHNFIDIDFVKFPGSGNFDIFRMIYLHHSDVDVPVSCCFSLVGVQSHLYYCIQRFYLSISEILNFFYLLQGRSEQY